MDKQPLTLREFLLTRSVRELRGLASGYSVKVTNKMRKEEMAAVVEKAILNPERLEKLLVMLDEAG